MLAAKRSRQISFLSVLRVCPYNWWIYLFFYLFQYLHLIILYVNPEIKGVASSFVIQVLFRFRCLGARALACSLAYSRI